MLQQSGSTSELSRMEQEEGTEKKGTHGGEGVLSEDVEEREEQSLPHYQATEQHLTCPLKGGHRAALHKAQRNSLQCSLLDSQ